MKVLLLNRYGRVGASSRLRLLQYIPWLAQRGIEVDTSPLLDDDYLHALYGGGDKSLHKIARLYIDRFSRLLTVKRYDLLWIEKELFPMLPALGELVLNLSGVRYIVDYDDAVFHRYDMHPNRFIRGLLKTKIGQVMKCATLVITGNGYLADRARSAGARWVEVVPTVVDIERYCVRLTSRQDIFTIGWIGTPCTAQYLRYAQEALRSLGKTGRVKVLLVGSGAVSTEGVVTEHRDWSEDTEVAAIQDFDVGIMPLLDGPWERGKCGYKLIQYMACGKPVVASPVGVNCEIVDHGVNGFLSASSSDWRSALTELMHSEELCTHMGSTGRRLVEQRYSLQVTAPRIVDLIIGALQRGG